jgi:hypothetical protein
MKDDHFEFLISAYLDGTITSAQREELEQRLLHSASDRSRFWQEAQTHAMLHSHAQTRLGAVPLRPETQSPKVSFFLSKHEWRPLSAAAAGLCIGLFSASLVFGFVVPSLRTRVELLNDSFESDAKPAVNGEAPLEPGHWGGDFADVVPARGHVPSADGKQMLRFVRADSEGHPLPNSFSSDTFRLFDLRPLKKEILGGMAVVKISALFNGEVPTGEGPFACVLKLYALDAELVEERKTGTFKGSIRERMLANSSTTRVRLDNAPDTWQRATNELRLPPETDYLLVQVGTTNESKLPGARRDTFGTHYVDHVQLVLAHLPEVSQP